MIDYKNIAKKQSKKKENNRPTSSKVKTNRVVLKEKQKLAGKGLGQAGQAFLGGMGRQTPTKTKKTKSVIESKSPRTGRATRVTKPVTGNIGEIKTQNNSNKIEEKRQQRKTLLRNRPTGHTTGKRTLKVEQARKSRPDKKDKSLDTSGKRTTKIEQARKAKISLQRAGGGKVGSKFFTGGMVNPSYGTEFDDR